MNLKHILMELGNRLVSRGARPSQQSVVANMRNNHGARSAGAKYSKAIWRGEAGASLEPIVLFTEWLNAYPDARNVLLELGVQWPTVGPRGGSEPTPGADATPPPDAPEPFRKMQKRQGVGDQGKTLASREATQAIVNRVRERLQYEYGDDCCDRANHWHDALAQVLMGQD
jgi:hypothetical protein